MITGGPEEPYSNKVEEGRVLAGRMMRRITFPRRCLYRMTRWRWEPLTFLQERDPHTGDMEVIVYGNNESLRSTAVGYDRTIPDA